MVVLDQVLGLRGWGLVVYGVLPANLALLGIVEVKVADTNHPSVLVALLVASTLPIFVTLLLIRSRQKEWYLTDDYLNLRSAITTIIIIICAALIFGASGIVHRKYVLTLKGHYFSGVAESLLFAVASLVITSTLFIGFLTKGGDLPGLPSSSIVALIATVRGKVRRIQASSIWTGFNPATDLKALESARKIAGELQDVLDGVTAYPGHALAKQSLEPVKIGVRSFISALEQILAPGANDLLRTQRWKTYFAHEDLLDDDRKTERSRNVTTYASLHEFKGLRVGGRDG